MYSRHGVWISKLKLLDGPAAVRACCRSLTDGSVSFRRRKSHSRARAGESESQEKGTRRRGAFRGGTERPACLRSVALSSSTPQEANSMLGLHERRLLLWFRLSKVSTHGGGLECEQHHYSVFTVHHDRDGHHPLRNPAYGMV